MEAKNWIEELSLGYLASSMHKLH